MAVTCRHKHCGSEIFVSSSKMGQHIFVQDNKLVHWWNEELPTRLKLYHWCSNCNWLFTLGRKAPCTFFRVLMKSLATCLIIHYYIAKVIYTVY